MRCTNIKRKLRKEIKSNLLDDLLACLSDQAQCIWSQQHGRGTRRERLDGAGRQHGELWRKTAGQEAVGVTWRRQKEWPLDRDTASATQERDKVLKREGGRGQSGDPGDEKKTAKLGWREPKLSMPPVLLLCRYRSCTGHCTFRATFQLS